MEQIKHRFLFGFILMLSFISCNKDKITEVQQHQFLKLYGGSQIDKANDVIETKNGGYVLTGVMATADKAEQAFFIRTDAYGNEIEKSPLLFGNNYFDEGNRIFETSTGDFIVIGTTSDNTQKDILVAKISSQGSLVWTKTFGGSQDEEGYFGRELSDGSYVFGGYSLSLGVQNKRMILYKTSSDGDSIWRFNTYGSQDEVGKDVLEANNKIILIGSSKNYSGKNNDVFLAVIDPSSGLGENSANFGGTDNEDAVRSIMLSYATILILGQTTPVNSGTSEIYMLELNTSNYNQPVWEQSFSNPNKETPYGFAVLNNTIIITGSSSSGSATNIFKHHIGLDGSDQSDIVITSRGNQAGNACIISSDNQLVIAGQDETGGYSKIVLMKTGAN